MRLRLREDSGASHEELMRFVLDTYGWMRLADNVRTYLTAAIRLMHEG